ncbi:MAG: aminoacetone oxidase family FAD-binding enzyme [Planctomycetes bacterium]|nr:aminoacetone oxidase family FAD-binding enzyme [Planctomycetota bacterium]
MNQRADIAVIGIGAAGLMAAIHAGRAGPGLRIIGLDGAKRLGAKILVAGGGRCNVTHDHVDERSYCGSSRNSIRNVLGRFNVPETVRFFSQLGVELKREETGKLFPVTDDAHTVLNALLAAAADARVQLLHPWRVASIDRAVDGFIICRAQEADPGLDPRAAPIIYARRVILATGGKALPRSGSDGVGYEFARSLGHTLTPVFPALVPLLLEKGHWITELSGLTLPSTIELRSGTGKRLVAFTDSTLLTHFGLSGPGVLDISRHLTATRQTDPGTHLCINWIPGETPEAIDTALQNQNRVTPVRFMQERQLPERLARALCTAAAVDPSAPCHTLTREKRRTLASTLTQTRLPITGDRGFTFAEVTAGGIPLTQVHLSTMESRVCPGLHLCGEILDVDGRIGGYNFQWAWASGFVAGVAAAAACPAP